MALVMRRISKHPVLRGMMAYSILWPSSNICQQLIHGREELNFKEAARFCIFGTLYVAPSLYVWVRISSRLFPGQSVKIAITKALCEQFTYGPFAITSFFIGMNLLEGKTWDEGVDELKKKFISTYKTGVFFWPVVQTINFAYVSQKNRVAVTSVASFFWTIFLSYMKHEKKI